jgi:3-phosphoglycerate kinase
MEVVFTTEICSASMTITYDGINDVFDCKPYRHGARSLCSLIRTRSMTDVLRIVGDTGVYVGTFLTDKTMWHITSPCGAVSGTMSNWADAKRLMVKSLRALKRGEPSLFIDKGDVNGQ